MLYTPYLTIFLLKDFSNYLCYCMLVDRIYLTAYPIVAPATVQSQSSQSHLFPCCLSLNSRELATPIPVYSAQYHELAHNPMQIASTRCFHLLLSVNHLKLPILYMFSNPILWGRALLYWASLIPTVSRTPPSSLHPFLAIRRSGTAASMRCMQRWKPPVLLPSGIRGR